MTARRKRRGPDSPSPPRVTMKSRASLLLLSFISIVVLSACESNRTWPESRVCPEVATVAPGGNQRFQLCDGLIADSLINWSTRGPGLIIQGRYHAPLVVPAPLRVIVHATPERWTGVLPGRAVVLLSPGSVPGVDSCAGPAQGHVPERGEYVYVEELPVAIHTVAPSYPDSARAHGVEGTVLVMALVCASGTIIDTYMVKSIPELDDAADHAVRQWIFQPAMIGGLPVAVWVAVPIRFTLNGPLGPATVATSH